MLQKDVELKEEDKEGIEEKEDEREVPKETQQGVMGGEDNARTLRSRSVRQHPPNEGKSKVKSEGDARVDDCETDDVLLAGGQAGRKGDRGIKRRTEELGFMHGPANPTTGKKRRH